MSQVGAPSRDWKKIRMLATLSAQQREVEGPCLLTADFQCLGGEWVETERFEDVLVTVLLL